MRRYVISLAVLAGVCVTLALLVTAPRGNAPLRTRQVKNAEPSAAPASGAPLLSATLQSAARRAFVVTRRGEFGDQLLRILNLVMDSNNSPRQKEQLSFLRTETQPSSGKNKLEILVCVRQWLYEMLQAAASNTPILPRHRMGEFHTWTSLLNSLRLSSCSVVLSSDCSELPFFESTNHSRRMLLTEDLSLYHLSKLTNSKECLQQASFTFAVVGAASKFFPAQRTLPVFYTPQVPVSLGIRVSSCIHPPSQKHWYAVLWGKTRQLAKLGVADAVRIVSRYIPVVSTCSAQCDEDLGTAVNMVNVTGEAFRQLVAHAVLVLGVHAPDQGTTVPEALSCGTFVVARGRNLGFEFAGHPLARRFRNPRRELDAIIRPLLLDLGFDFSHRWNDQPNPPDTKKLGHAPHLPSRYTSLESHAEHIRAIFGVDADCTITNRTSYVQTSLGKPLPGGWTCPTRK